MAVIPGEAPPLLQVLEDFQHRAVSAGSEDSAGVAALQVLASSEYYWVYWLLPVIAGYYWFLPSITGY